MALSVIAVTCLSSYLSDGENLFSEQNMAHTTVFMFMYPSYVAYIFGIYK